MENRENQLLERLNEALKLSKTGIAFSTSLSWEDQLITHVIFKNNLPIRVFTLDTGRLFPETYSTLSATRNQYGKSIEVFFPQAAQVEKLMTEKGPMSFYESVENRKECCFIRKVEPLNRALKNVDVWITGLRAEQSDNRANVSLQEWDSDRSLYKFQPIFDWTLEEVRAFLQQEHVPVNVLQDRGFVSIGCQPCTRAIEAGESFRAGRWWWEDNSKKECGLHH